MSNPKQLNCILLFNDVLLPGGLLKIPFSSPKSLKLVKELISAEDNSILGILPCKNKNDFAEGAIATAAGVVDLNTLTWSKKSFILSVMGIHRIRVEKILSNDPYPVASVTVIEDDYNDFDDETNKTFDEFKSQASQVFNNFEAMHHLVMLTKYRKILGNAPPKTTLIDLCAYMVTNNFEEKLDLLKTIKPADRMQKLFPLITRYLKGSGYFRGMPSLLPLIDDSLKDKISPMRFNVMSTPPLLLKNFKRHNFHMSPPTPDEDDELEDKIKALNLPEAVLKVVNRELNHLKRLSRHHLDYSVHRNYLELVAELPWNKRSIETINIVKSKQDLDADHFGMEKVKKRVLEFLAVRQLKNNLKGPMLCFVGAPGVGKTSIARSIASSLGRKFHRISLGGVCHHSDIRGHRKTYVGAMPGRIIQAIKTVGVKNPVILLDEVEKLSKSMNGDPASALLEVLDSEQNSSFVDHYLNIPFDLSEVIFLATANTTKTIDPALKDRLEIINIPGYSLEEKKLIAERHLLPKQLLEHGLPPFAISIPEDILSYIISGYTREAGVRSLERKLAAVCRRAAINVTCGDTIDFLKNDNTQTLLVTKEVVEDVLGPLQFEGGMIGWKDDTPGIVVGLCWTVVGGDVMLVEATKVYGGSNSLILTGQLGSVMKESAKIALNWFKSTIYKNDLEEFFDHIDDTTDVHVHFPAGAVSKDGPSAGITVAVALVSLFSGIPVLPDIAFTGELTLRGSILPVGGLKEKLVAAHAAGVKTVVIPALCRKNLTDVPKNILANLDIVLVNDMDEVIKAAFKGQIVFEKGNNFTSKL